MQSSEHPSELAQNQPATPIVDARYKNIITQLLRVANRHKTSMLVTSLVGVLPLLLAIICAIVIVYIAPHLEGTTGTPSFWPTLVVAVMMALFFITPFWMVVINRIARIQQVLWVKSYFDNNATKDRGSLKKALRLVWPGVRLSLGMFVHYYWMFWLAVSLFYGGIIFSIIQNTGAANDGLSTFLIMVMIISIPIVLISYFFVAQFVGLRTRYVLIVFADTYGKPGFSYAHVFAENRRVTHLDSSRGKSFGELLSLSAGVDATVTGGASIIGVGAATASQFGGKVGQAAGTLGMMYGSEAVALTETLAQTIISYMYYRAATDGTITTGESSQH